MYKKEYIILSLLLSIPTYLSAEIFKAEQTTMSSNYHEMRGFNSETTNNKSSGSGQQIMPMPIPSVDISKIQIDINDSIDANDSKEVYVTPLDINTSTEENITNSSYNDSIEETNKTTTKGKVRTNKKFTYTGNKLPIAGKLYFKYRGKAMSCSASLIDGSNILLTAAHCIYTHKVMHTDIEYYPFASLNSKEHYKASALQIPKEWKDSTNYAYDYAFVKLSAPVRGDRVNLHSTFNPKANQFATAYGYPLGIRLSSVTNIYNYIKTTIGNNSTGIGYLHMKNNLRSGSSGGPWVSNGLVVGLNSFHPMSGRRINYKVMYSPYFSRAFEKQLEGIKAY